MTDEYPAGANSVGSPSAASASSTAKDQAQEVGHTVVDSAKDVAGVAKEETATVVGESKKQAKALYEESRTQLASQAEVQQQRVAAGLRNIGDELQRMADSSEQPGVAQDIVSQVASRTSGAASWLDGRDPGSLMSEVKNFARRKPGTFIAISAVAGIVAGRLVRSLASEAKDEAGSAAAPEPTVPGANSEPVTTPMPPSSETPIYDTTIGNGSAS